MSRMPRMPDRYPVPVAPTAPRRQRRRPWKFSWRWVSVLATVMVLMWIINSIKPGISWSGFMSDIDIEDPEHFSRLAILCVVGTAIVWIVKIIKTHSKK